MKTGKMIFDGVEYDDAEASDAIAMQWMQGSPPPKSKRIRFQDDRFLAFPQLRWTLSHMREIFPTVTVWRGSNPPSARAAIVPDLETRIDAMRFKDLSGRELTWSQSLAETYTDGILVLHRGKPVYEKYSGVLQPQRPHACFSITKSYAATLAATLVYENALDENKTVAHYLPELAHGAYADATLRQVLDMQIGVAYSEEYSDARADVWDYGRAGGLRPRAADYSGASNYYEYLTGLRKQGEHGKDFIYKTVNTEVLCWVMSRVTGKPLQDLLSERLWSRIGCEEDGYLAVDSIGVAMGGGGLNATLRDMARFGELMRCEGAQELRQILPAAVIADIRKGSDPAKFASAGYDLLPGYSYRNMWWVAPQSQGVFEGRGIYGQRLYISPSAEMVIARFSSHPIASSSGNDPITLPAFAALSAMLMNQ